MRMLIIIILVINIMNYCFEEKEHKQQLEKVKLENTELKIKLQEDKCYCTKLKFCDTLTDKQAEYEIRRHSNR